MDNKVLEGAYFCTSHEDCSKKCPIYGQHEDCAAFFARQLIQKQPSNSNWLKITTTAGIKHLLNKQLITDVITDDEKTVVIFCGDESYVVDMGIDQMLEQLNN